MANLQKLMNTLNGIYEPLQERAVRLVSMLDKLDAKVEWGYYGGHTVEVKGEQLFETFPIPIVTVKDVCDVGIDVEGAFVEGKLYAEQIQQTDFSPLRGRHFCIYGAEDYLTDLFDSNSDAILDIPSMLAESSETEFCICVIFDVIPLMQEIVALCGTFKEMGTHILAYDNEQESDVNNEERPMERKLTKLSMEGATANDPA